VIHSFDAMRLCMPALRSKRNHIPRSNPSTTTNLVHLSDQSIDLVFPVTQVTTLNKMSELASSESSSGVAELEWPQEVGSLLEVGANGEDLVDQILHADDAVLAKAGLDDRVVGKSNALLLNLSISTLVDELTDGLEVGVSVSNPWLNDLKHFEGGLGHADKDTVVDLEETEKLKDLAGLWCNLVNTLNTDNEDQLVLSRDVVGTILLRKAGKTDLLTLLITIFLDVLLSTLEDDTALLLLCLLLLLKLGGSLLSCLLLTLTLLQESLGDEDLIMGRDRSVSGLWLVLYP